MPTYQKRDSSEINRKAYGVSIVLAIWGATIKFSTGDMLSIICSIFAF